MWNLPETQNRLGLRLSAAIERRLGARAGLLVIAMFLALMTFAMLALPGRDRDPLRWIVALGLFVVALYVIGVYLGRLINGEGGREAASTRIGMRRPPSSGIQRFIDRFRSQPARLARRGDIEGLLALSLNGSSKDRAESINRLWGLSAGLEETQRVQLANIARRAAHDPDDGVRGQALFALGESADPSDLATLEAALSDPAWFPRLAAAYALSWGHMPEALGSIARLLGDDEPMVRDQIAGILRAVAQRKTDEATRQQAIAALDDAGLPLSE